MRVHHPQETSGQRGSESHPQPTQSTGGRITTRIKKLQDDQEAMSGAFKDLEGKVAVVKKIVETVVDKVTDLSMKTHATNGKQMRKNRTSHNTPFEG